MPVDGGHHLTQCICRVYSSHCNYPASVGYLLAIGSHLPMVLVWYSSHFYHQVHLHGEQNSNHFFQGFQLRRDQRCFKNDRAAKRYSNAYIDLYRHPQAKCDLTNALPRSLVDPLHLYQ